ncbi:MAG: MarR family transcriptional regulator [Planctomycetia bacterium]|nr:MarR family transcriptional regulator [Planctomycetia bacterium]
MNCNFENTEVEPFLKMSFIIDKLRQMIHTSSLSQAQVALMDSLSKRQEKSLFVVSRLTVTKPEGITLTELAERLHMTVPATSVLVESMVRKQLLLRVTSSKDRRAVCIKISPLGEEIHHNCCTKIEHITNSLVQDLDSAQKQAFRDVIRHLYNKLFEEENLSRTLFK